MVIVEALAAIFLIGAVSLAVIFGGRALGEFFGGFTLEGRIRRKRAELAKHLEYINRLSSGAGGRKNSTRLEILNSYATLANKKREQLETQLMALELEKDRREFESNMKRRDI